MTSFFNGSTPGPIELPVTAYHHHDVESLSEVSTIYLDITHDDTTSQPTRKTRSRPPLERKFTSRTYPEGGQRAWMVVLGSYCGMMASFGFMATSKLHFGFTALG
jgi:hypothetical protein